MLSYSAVFGLGLARLFHLITAHILRSLAARVAVS